MKLQSDKLLSNTTIEDNLNVEDSIGVYKMSTELATVAVRVDDEGKATIVESGLDSNGINHYTP